MRMSKMQINSLLDSTIDLVLNQMPELEVYASTEVVIKSALEGGLVTVDEARQLFAACRIDKPVPATPAPATTWVGVENYNRIAEQRRESAPRVICREREYRNRGRKAALAAEKPPHEAMILRGGRWVDIFATH